MRKVLLFGKLNSIVKEVDSVLSEHFSVQICDLKSDAAAGMMKVVEPDLVVIILVGAVDFERGVFGILSTDYTRIPVITIGTEQERDEFLKYFRGKQFEHLIRPVENKTILETACRRLNLKIKYVGDKVFISDPYRKKNVMIVDDNPVAIRSVREMIKDEYDVTVATSGMKAMTSIGRQRPDLILLDYEMPVCDGKQTLEMIRADKDLKDIPVIFLTGISDRGHIKAVLDLKPQGYMLKPPSKDDLLEKIKQVLQ